MKKVTKEQERENFINEYLKENLYQYEPSPSIKLKNYHIKMAKRQYNKKDVRKQKVQKWIAIGGGIVVSLFSGAYILTH